MAVEDNELIALLDKKFAEAEQRLDARFEKVDGRFQQVDSRFDRLEGEVHHTRVLVEDLRDKIQQVAEGVDNSNERLDRFRAETLCELKDIRTDLRVSFTMLGNRITDLENSRS